jgi:hypothetical protein
MPSSLPGDRALLPPSSAEMFCLSPVGPTQLRELDASVGASGPHDFAVRCNISRRRAGDRSRGQKNPPCDPLARKTLPRPPHPVPNVRDDRDTPLLWDGMRRVLEVIWGLRKQKYFCKQDWTAQIRLKSHNKSPRTRDGFGLPRWPIRGPGCCDTSPASPQTPAAAPGSSAYWHSRRPP